MKKIILSIILAFAIIFGVTVSSNIQAQSGEGVDVCTWYSANGFSSKTECENWYDFQKNSNTPAWYKKFNNCLSKSIVATTTEQAISAVLGYANIQVAIVTFGTEFVTCVFD